MCALSMLAVRHCMLIKAQKLPIAVDDDAVTP